MITKILASLVAVLFVSLTFTGWLLKATLEDNTLLEVSLASSEVKYKTLETSLDKMQKVFTTQTSHYEKLNEQLTKLQEHSSRVEAIAIKRPESYERLVNKDHKEFWGDLVEATDEKTTIDNPTAVN